MCAALNEASCCMLWMAKMAPWHLHLSWVVHDGRLNKWRVPALLAYRRLIF